MFPCEDASRAGRPGLPSGRVRFWDAAAPAGGARDQEGSRVPLPAGPVVGTCGFGYPEWRGRFYPPELPPASWLGFYAQVFEAVELDGTFYRPPEPAQVAVWAEALPERFAVPAKVPRAVTHEARLQGEAAAAMLRAFARALGPLGDRRATPTIGRPVRDRAADLD